MRALIVRKEERVNRPAKLSEFRLHAFDPNLATHEELTNLGIPQRIAYTIINYRKKGGSFETKGDLSQIYGLSDQLFQKLHPFIKLPDSIPTMKNGRIKEAKWEGEKSVIGDLNLVNSEELKEIRGIGEVLSKRIIVFRERLGGFVRADQLKEVYGLQDSIANQVLLKYQLSDTVPIHTIDLAIANLDSLRKHPYINYKMGKVILAFRDQHKIKDLEQLREIKIMNDSLFQKIKPYLSVGTIKKGD